MKWRGGGFAEEKSSTLKRDGPSAETEQSQRMSNVRPIKSEAVTGGGEAVRSGARRDSARWRREMAGRSTGKEKSVLNTTSFRVKAFQESLF